MLTTTKGIVLHHFKYSEKSIIAKIYTKDYGLRSYIINGVRSSKSKNKAAYLQPLSLVELIAIQKENRSLNTIKTISLSIPFTNIPFNIIKTSIAFFIAEVLYKTIKEEESNKKLYEFLVNAFLMLDLSETINVDFHLIFLGNLSKYLGFHPSTESDSIDFFDLQEGCFTDYKPAHQAFISKPLTIKLKSTLNASLSDIDLSLTNIDRKALLKVFLDYYHLHLSNFDNLKSIAVLEEVLN